MTRAVDKERLWRTFDELRQLGESARRAALEQLAAREPELARELATLLAPAPSSFLEASPFALRFGGGSPAAKAEELRAPEGLIDGKYRVLERVGVGSMGFVHRAEHVELKKAVAIKFLRASGAHPQDASQVIAREARAVAAIRHENVVAVHDVGVFDGHAYMVMDWIDGVDLQQWLAHAEGQGYFDAPPARGAMGAFLESRLGRGSSAGLWSRPYCEIAAYLIARVARGVAAAHAGGIIHRDIAPKNVIVTAEGRPYLLDFGLVSLVAARRPGEKLPPVAGTLPYMAPEQLAPDRKAPDAAVDTYGLGATLYHLLVGRPPFQGRGPSLYEELRKNLPPPVRSLRPEVPRDLEAICFAAMEKRVEARYPSAAALAEDLEAFLDRRPVSRRPPGPAGRLARWCQRNPARAAAGAALAGLLLVGALFLREDLRERARLEHVAAAEAFASRFAALPATATIDADARYAAPPLRVAIDEDLGPAWDELVALRPEEPVLRWYRANWRSQHGLLAGAAADLDALRAQGLGTALVEAVGAKLVSENAIERNQLVEPDALPERANAFDHAVAGYVRLRRRELSAAWQELTRALELQPGQWLVRDLRALAGLDTPNSDLSFEDAALVEQEVGRPTSRTLHVRAFLMRERQPQRACELWTQALELGGEQHQVLHGLGELLVARGAYADALPLLERANTARSGGWRLAMLKSRALVGLGDFAAAERALDEGFNELQPGRPAHLFPPEEELAFERARLCADWGLHLENAGEPEAAREQVVRARTLLMPLAVDSALAAPVRLENESLVLRLEQQLGERDAQACVLRMRELHVEYLRLPDSGGQTSPMIAVNLSWTLLNLEQPPLDEAEALLLSAQGSNEIEARKDAEKQLARLAGLRHPGNQEEKQ
jgi:serine/threonine protein kinase/tetratricopeptide (TPR) repeat protein